MGHEHVTKQIILMIVLMIYFVKMISNEHMAPYTYLNLNIFCVLSYIGFEVTDEMVQACLVPDSTEQGKLIESPKNHYNMLLNTNCMLNSPLGRCKFVSSSVNNV